MNWIIENWFLIVALAACGITIGLAIYKFLGLPTEKQVEKIKEWLVSACIEAERSLQSDTGQLKLREVWRMFCAVPAFTWVARIISFDMFSLWVKEALKTAKAILINNRTLANYVYGEDKAEKEVEKLKSQLEE